MALLDVQTLVTLLLAVFLGVVVPRLLRRRPAAPREPRGDAVLVLECVRLEAKSRAGASAAADARWIECHANFGTQLKALRGVSAARDASFCAVVAVEPLRNFEDGLQGALQDQLVDNYLRSLCRAAAGLVPVFFVCDGRDLLKLTPGGFLARPVIEALGASDAVPAPAAAVVDALRRPLASWDDAPAVGS